MYSPGLLGHKRHLDAALWHELVSSYASLIALARKTHQIRQYSFWVAGSISPPKSPHSSPTAPSIQHLTHTLSTHRSSLPPSLTIDTDTSWTSPSQNAYRLVIHILYCQLEVMLYRHTQLHPHLQQSLPRDVMARRLENTLVTAGELVRRVVRLDLVGWMPGFMYVLFPLPLPYLISRVNKDLTNK